MGEPYHCCQGLIADRQISKRVSALLSTGQLWPKVNAVATKRFHEFADPLIQQSKPSWVYHVEMQK